jgi:hypothetical protein
MIIFIENIVRQLFYNISAIKKILKECVGLKICKRWVITSLHKNKKLKRMKLSNDLLKIIKHDELNIFSMNFSTKINQILTRKMLFINIDSIVFYSLRLSILLFLSNNINIKTFILRINKWSDVLKLIDILSFN